MGSYVGQIFPTASLHSDHLISCALVCEKEISHMGKNNGTPDLVCEKNRYIYKSRKRNNLNEQLCLQGADCKSI